MITTRIGGTKFLVLLIYYLCVQFWIRKKEGENISQ